MTEVNIPLLYQVLGHITAHPETWYQGDWVAVINTHDGMRMYEVLASSDPQSTHCMTAGCFAGWVGVLSPEIEFIGVTPGTHPEPNQRLLNAVKYNGRQVTLSHAAREVLGLTDHQSDRLFNGNNDLQDIARVVREIVEEAQRPPKLMYELLVRDGLELTEDEAEALRRDLQKIFDGRNIIVEVVRHQVLATPDPLGF